MPKLHRYHLRSTTSRSTRGIKPEGDALSLLGSVWVMVAIVAACSPTDDPMAAPDAMSGCTSDQHACGETCVDNRPNTPDVGCALGCDGACPTPTNGVSSCSTDGTCTSACNQGFARIGNQCVAEICQQLGYICGTYNDGQTDFDCGTCFGTTPCGTDHACDIPRDSLESNDSLGAATQLGDYNDADDRIEAINGLSIDSLQDEDWFQFHVTDGFDGGDPLVLVSLWGFYQNGVAPDPTFLASSHRLAVWFKCDEPDNGSTIRCDDRFLFEGDTLTTDPSLGIGCTVESLDKMSASIRPSCDTTSENGTVTVQVRKDDIPRGDSYALVIEVR